MYLLRQKTFCAVVKHKKYMNPLRTSGKFTTGEFGSLLSSPSNSHIFAGGEY